VKGEALGDVGDDEAGDAADATTSDGMDDSPAQNSGTPRCVDVANRRRVIDAITPEQLGVLRGARRQPREQAWAKGSCIGADQTGLRRPAGHAPLR
jgi:hypothetical protein